MPSSRTIRSSRPAVATADVSPAESVSPAANREVRSSRRLASRRRSVSSEDSSSSGSPIERHARPRRQPRRNSNRLSDFSVDDGIAPSNQEADHHHHNQQQQQRPEATETRRQLSVQTSSGGRNSSRATLTANSNGRGGTHLSYQRRSRACSEGLSWYERLMPEIVLSVTSPLTGYETELERDELADLSEAEIELLERERFRRNRRVRRRLLALVLVTSLASAYFIYRGRGSTGLLGMRRPPQGVRGTIGEMAHRFEDGLSKTIHDTMGK